MPPLAGHVAFYWDRLDEWLEEDEPLIVHVRDPYHRTDVLDTSRHVRVEVGGVTVAESSRARVLYGNSSGGSATSDASASPQLLRGRAPVDDRVAEHVAEEEPEAARRVLGGEPGFGEDPDPDVRDAEPARPQDRPGAADLDQ